MMNIRKTKASGIFVVAIIGMSMIGISFSGFTDSLSIHGSIQTAYVKMELRDFSKTIVYKDLDTHGIIISDTELYDDNLLDVASAICEPGYGDPYDVNFVYDNIFPCIDFSADFVVEYVGTIPVNLIEMEFYDIEPWVIPFLNYRFHRCHYESEELIIDEEVYVGVQLHSGDLLHVEVIIYLPQDNQYQDKSGEFKGKLTIMQWNDQCIPVDVKEFSLPEKCNMTVSDGPDSYLVATLTDVPPGHNVVEGGQYLAWCIDEDWLINLGVLYTTYLYSSIDPGNPFTDDDWDLVNWIINNKDMFPSATVMDFQEAIWYLIDEADPPSTTEGQNIVDTAIINGEGFIPQTGDLCCVITYVDAGVQQLILEVDP